MKQHIVSMCFGSLILLFLVIPAAASEMRELQIEAQQAREELARKASEEKLEAEKAARESRMQISRDRESLEREIKKLRVQNDNLKKEIQQQEKKSAQLEEKEQSLNERLDQVDGMVRELVGVIRSNAKDLGDLIAQNGQTQLVRNHYTLLETLVENAIFPSMDEVAGLHRALVEQIRMTGEVSLASAVIIDRAGLEMDADVLFIGPFTSMYRTEEELGFLNYSFSGNKLYALSHLPPGHMQKDIDKYMRGDQERVPVDISKGAALRQLSYQKNLVDQIGGGPVVWPIMGILVAGLLIVLERIFTLTRKHHRNVPVFGRLKVMIRENDWGGCEQVCRDYVKKPIARVLLAGVSSHKLPREDMENVLQEAILREIPVLERFLSTLGMLVAIAPLLGLLGTVTGMINVFHVITLNGTGDPRLMSGGISEALVTTMLGLGVAIPLMLLHNVLNRTVDRMVAEMEEKGVALVNLIHKERKTV